MQQNRQGSIWKLLGQILLVEILFGVAVAIVVIVVTPILLFNYEGLLAGGVTVLNAVVVLGLLWRYTQKRQQSPMRFR